MLICLADLWKMVPAAALRAPLSICGTVGRSPPVRSSRHKNGRHYVFCLRAGLVANTSESFALVVLSDVDSRMTVTRWAAWSVPLHWSMQSWNLRVLWERRDSLRFASCRPQTIRSRKIWSGVMLLKSQRFACWRNAAGYCAKVSSSASRYSSVFLSSFVPTAWPSKSFLHLRHVAASELGFRDGGARDAIPASSTCVITRTKLLSVPLLTPCYTSVVDFIENKQDKNAM